MDKDLKVDFPYFFKPFQAFLQVLPPAFLNPFPVFVYNLLISHVFPTFFPLYFRYSQPIPINLKPPFYARIKKEPNGVPTVRYSIPELEPPVKFSPKVVFKQFIFRCYFNLNWLNICFVKLDIGLVD